MMYRKPRQDPSSHFVLLWMTRLVVVAFISMASPAHAETPTSRTQIDLSFAPLVKQASPSVVNIYTTRKVTERVNPMFDDPFVQRFFGGMAPGGQMRQRVENSLGSGVIVRGDGLIVTNAHVIRDADEIRAVLTDRREFPAAVVMRDDHADLAVLRIDTGGDHLPALPLADSDKAEVGDLVLAIGNPFGVGQTVTNGIVSAMGRSAEGISEYNEFLQTDAPINPGNSGGALIDMSGHLLGINAAIYSRDGGSLGIGFAIPANTVATVIQAAETGHKPVRPWIGITGQAVTADLAAPLGLKRPEGMIVRSVTPGSPAADAGIKTGDVLLSVADHEVFDTPSLRDRLASLKLGKAVPLAIYRNGASETVEVTPIAPPEAPARDETKLKGRQPLSGATVVNLSPAVIDDLGSAAAQKGVIVTQVPDNTLAAQVGLQVGDIILAINGAPVATVAELAHAVAHPQPQWQLSIQRGDQVINSVLGG
jgi:serine protease Do